MSDRLAIVERIADGGLIRFERDFPNSPDDVWSALTDADRLADWWRGRALEVTGQSVEMRGPFRPEGFEPVVEFAKRFAAQAVEAPLSIRANRHQTRIPQDSQVP